MRITDFTIIYLSLGAPVAVYAYFDLARRTAAARFLLSMAAILIWPAFFAYHIAGTKSVDTLRRASSKPSSVVTDAERLSRELLDLVRVDVFSERKGETLFQCRDILGRYVALSTAEIAEVRPPQADIFSVAGHPKPSLAAECVRRRDSARIGRHTERVRREFVDFFLVARPFPPNLLAVAGRLAAVVGDVRGETSINQEAALRQGRAAAETRLTTSRAA